MSNSPGTAMATRMDTASMGSSGPPRGLAFERHRNRERQVFARVVSIDLAAQKAALADHDSRLLEDLHTADRLTGAMPLATLNRNVAWTA